MNEAGFSGGITLHEAAAPHLFPIFNRAAGMLIARLTHAIVWLLLFAAPHAHAAEPAPTSPLNLDALIAQSLRNHPSIAAARAELNAAQADTAAARSQYWPTPSAQVLQNQGDASTILTLQQPVWAGGRIDAGLALAESRTDAARIAISDAQYTLGLRVTAAWAAWKQAHGRVLALNEGVALLNVYVLSVQRRIEGGASAEVDRALVAARLAQTQGDLAAARSAERSALSRLAQMTGLALRSADLTDSEAPEAARTAHPTETDAMLAQALAHSAALKRLAADIEAARHETDQKRGALWPTLNLRAQHQRTAATATTAANTDSSLMLVLEYAPGAGLADRAKINAAEARRVTLQEKREAARRELIETVSADLEEHRASLERSHEAQRALQATAEVLASYDRLFVAGKRGWLDVINAARELIQARTAFADIEAQRLAVRARLRLHLGEIPV